MQASVEGDAVRLPVLDVDARNVRASLDTLRTGQGDVVADTVNGTGTISYDSLAALLNRPGLTLGEQNGKLAVTAPVDILGQKLTITGTADVTVADNGAVALRFNDLDAAGSAEPAAGPRPAEQLRPEHLHRRAPAGAAVPARRPGGPAAARKGWRSPPTRRTCRSTPLAEAAGAVGRRRSSAALVDSRMVVGPVAAPVTGW